MANEITTDWALVDAQFMKVDPVWYTPYTTTTGQTPQYIFTPQYLLDTNVPKLPVHYPTKKETRKMSREEVLKELPSVLEEIKDETEGRDEELEAYVALAKKLGVSVPAADRVHVLRKLQKAEIPVYDRGKVERYLSKLQEAANIASGKRLDWNWIPLNGNGPMQYTDPIPFYVLKRMESVNDLFPGAHFYVSKMNQDPDPFLMVAIQGFDMLVIAHWDEPGFKLSEK